MHSTNIESLLAMNQGLFYVLDETKITALMAITVYNQKSFPDRGNFWTGRSLYIHKASGVAFTSLSMSMAPPVVMTCTTCGILHGNDDLILQELGF